MRVKIVNSNKIKIENGTAFIYDQQAKRYRYFNWKSFPFETQVYIRGWIWKIFWLGISVLIIIVYFVKN